MPTLPDTTRTYAWQRTLDSGSVEHAAIGRSDGALSIQGTVLAVHEGAPLRLDYRLHAGADDRTQALHLTLAFAGAVRRLSLVRDEEGRWWQDGQPALALADCTDVDLGLSPATNAMPIARLDAAGTGEADITAAWVRFPTLEVLPAVQRYTRLAADRWRYHSLASGFTATLRVDDWGLPVDYEGVWRLIGRAPGTLPVPGEGFAAALQAAAPSPELGPTASEFDWLVGGWRASVRDIDHGGRERTGQGEWWFSWVLEGRAMQDVWISPPRGQRTGPRPANAAANRYGTTLRRLDQASGRWRISWFNPVTGAHSELVGRRHGDRIVLMGSADGVPVKWQFVDIRDDRFTWQGFELEPDGSSWRLQAQFDLQRIVTAP